MFSMNAILRDLFLVSGVLALGRVELDLDCLLVLINIEELAERLVVGRDDLYLHLTLRDARYAGDAFLIGLGFPLSAELLELERSGSGYKLHDHAGAFQRLPGRRKNLDRQNRGWRSCLQWHHERHQ